MTSSQKPKKNSTEQSSPDRDNDDISVIAVIKKGTSGIPKRARYHYIRELPLQNQSKPNKQKSDQKPEAMPAEESDDTNSRESRTVIELGDRHSKMALRRQFNVEMGSPETVEERFPVCTDGSGYGDMDILQKLPPGTVLIKQERRNHRHSEDSDYVGESSKDSTDTCISSGGSAVSVNTEKAKKVHQRTTRGKKIIEVRRNPARFSKTKNVDSDFPRPRQCLLAAKRAGDVAVPEPSKRLKLPSMPYMKTRSVTRKLYTVGATYQAPTMKDETEWKEWPVHGMHERPVFHPQVGLASEYLGRLFSSIDGNLYRGTLEQPEIEVVSVDPRPKRMSLLSTEKHTKKTSFKAHDPLSQSVQQGRKNESDSFEVCMHNSLHSVLAYCAQAVDPAYTKNVEYNFKEVESKPEAPVDGSDAKEVESKGLLAISIKEHWKKSFQDKLDPVKDEASANITRISQNLTVPEEPTRNHSQNSSMDLVVLREPCINLPGAKNVQTNHASRSVQSKSQDVGYSSQNPIVLSKTAETVVRSNRDTFPTTRHGMPITNPTELNLTKLEDSAISDETLMEMSSIYTKLDLTSSTENSPTDTKACNSSSLKHAQPKFCISLTAADAMKRQQDNMKLVTVTEVNDSCVLPRYEISDVKNATYTSPGASKAWNTSKTSEIARILAEYNQSLRNPGMQGMYQASSKVCGAGKLRIKLDRLKPMEPDHEFGENIASRVVQCKEPQQEKWKRLVSLGLETREKVTRKPEYIKCVKGMAGLSVPRQDEKQEDIDRIKVIELSRLKQRAAADRDSENKEKVRDLSGKKQWLQELLEDTAVLYCAAAGVHQNDLANYVDSLDKKQSIQWLQDYHSRGNRNSL